jgi:hypothetical protein
MAKKKPKDNARKVAQAGGGELITDQVRQLRALSDGKVLTRAALKKALGIEGKYSGRWLDSLWELNSRKLISIREIRDKRDKCTHRITALGKRKLAGYEKKAGKPETVTPEKPRRLYSYNRPLWWELRVTLDEHAMDNPRSSKPRIKSYILDGIKEVLLEILRYKEQIHSVDITDYEVEDFKPDDKGKSKERKKKFVLKTFDCRLSVSIEGTFTFSEEEVEDPDSDDPEIKESACQSLTDSMCEQVDARWEATCRDTSLENPDSDSDVLSYFVWGMEMVEAPEEYDWP